MVEPAWDSSCLSLHFLSLKINKLYIKKKKKSEIQILTLATVFLKFVGINVLYKNIYVNLLKLSTLKNYKKIKGKTYIWMEFNKLKCKISDSEKKEKE